MITIISKIELEGTDNLNYTDVGYTTDISVINEINEARTEVENVDALSLIEITNVNQL